MVLKDCIAWFCENDVKYWEKFCSEMVFLLNTFARSKVKKNKKERMKKGKSVNRNG